MPPIRKNKPITHERLLQVIDYDPDTGIFTWRAAPSATRRAGEVAGCINKHLKCILIGIDNHRYYGHHIAWFYVHGEWPEDEIDHRNSDRLDNRILNLRQADRSQNLANRRCGRLRGNAAGYKGVEKHRHRWAARIRMYGVRKFLGDFDTPEEAHAAYCKTAAEMHGEFARVA